MDRVSLASMVNCPESRHCCESRKSSLLQNQFDSIDLSDNAITRLEGFPRLQRLKQLLLNNNRIARIAKGVHGGHYCCGSFELYVGWVQLDAGWD